MAAPSGVDVVLVGDDGRNKRTDAVPGEELRHPCQGLRRHALRAHPPQPWMWVSQRAGQAHIPAPRSSAAVGQPIRKPILGAREEDRACIDKNRAVPEHPVRQDDLAPADEESSFSAGLRHVANIRRKTDRGKAAARAAFGVPARLVLWRASQNGRD